MIDKITEIALKSLLYEVAATPKPGLVDRHSNGAHTDMDFFTFMDSSISLRTYFEEIKHAIINIYGSTSETLCDAEVVFKTIKPLGIDAEKKMLSCTKGVNTHKGAIYALGLLVASATELELSHGIQNVCGNERISYITERASQYVLPHMDIEFSSGENYRNYGVDQFKKYGLLGARGEAASGFFHARVVGLKALENAITSGLSQNDAMVQSLLSIISSLEDSNVIGRRDRTILAISQAKAAYILELGGMHTKAGVDELNTYCQWCIAENISHGGSADLLVVTLFLYFIKQEGKD